MTKFKFLMIILLITLLTFMTACAADDSLILSSENVFDNNDGPIEFKKIMYDSNGVAVEGYIVKPKEIEEPLPVMIFNRGGSRDFGKLTKENLLKGFRYSAMKGYVVLASQYRGAGDSEGEDEFGGKDVQDVLALIDLAKELDYADENNIFMLGVSRGGMMTYQACRATDQINAAVVRSGVSDVIKNYNNREVGMKRTLTSLIGSRPEEGKEEYKKRSAVYWADEIQVPLLIIHGGEDRRVDVSQAKEMAEKLEQYNKEHQLIIYPEDDHALTENRMEAMKETYQWFHKFKKN